MILTLGADYFEAKRGNNVLVTFDTKKSINPHMLILGQSGAGKSYTYRRLINEGKKWSSNIRFHIYDVHGDLDVPGASSVRFSEVSPYGLNPLRVNPDPDFGGVRKCIQSFIRILNQSVTQPLGIQQETVLRNLLEDVFRDYGFELRDPSTWSMNEYESRLVSAGSDNRLYLQVPFAEKDEASKLGAHWDGAQRLWWVPVHRYAGGLKKWPPAFKPRTYPTVVDVRNYAQRLYEERFLGTDQKAVAAVQALNKAAKAHHRKVLEKLRMQKRGDHDDAQESSLQDAKDNAVAAFVHYVNSVQTGHELENILKYESAEVVKSVINRLNSLIQSGIFKSKEADFDPDARVWRYNLRALEQEQKKMLVLFLLQDLFNAAVQRGESSDVVDIIILDELSLYTSTQDDKGDGIIGVIARQARKFGLALWAADQSPANIPEGLASSVAAKIVLGIDETKWQSAVAKLRMELKLLEWVTPRATCAVQIKEAGTNKSRWRWVQLASD